MTAILRSRITPAQFVAKWRPVQLSERAAAHSHFNDVCDLLDHPRPLDVDPRGEWFTFEKGVKKAGGGDGFADVWKRENFAWEYKKKKRNLDDALDQLARYALALENPPLHIVCDTDRFRIVTAYTNCVAKSYDISLEDLLVTEKRQWLETAFHEPTKLKPGAKRSDLTKQAADKFSTLALRLQAKKHAPEDVAHFVNRLVFLFFAEDVRLLKEGFFRRTVAELAGRPSDAQDLLTGLFRTFQTGGRFGLDLLPWINGGLFDNREALPLDDHEIGLLKAASSQNWSHIDPTIFGTLFERFLDPSKRAQIGAHYTDPEKIKQIVDPVVLRPLRDEWKVARAEIEVLVNKAAASGAKSKIWQRAEERRSAFLERLRKLSILDPACGSGNFLYLALHGVKDLEHAVNQECEAMGLPPRMPLVGPEILRGIEINPLAAELARMTVWIGDIQWGVQNGFNTRPEPILRSLKLIENRDAILDADGSRAAWPTADFAIGNPPFIGDKKMIGLLTEDYVSSLRKAYAGKVAAGADFVMYWFWKALQEIKSGRQERAGFVATQSIRRGASNAVLKDIVAQGRIYDAWEDEAWAVDGADVRVSLVCFDGKREGNQYLNGKIASQINCDLTSESLDLTQATPLDANSFAYIGDQKSGSFEVDGDTARKWLKLPKNPNGKSNKDVLKPWANGNDVTGRNSDKWIIDFGVKMSLEEACLFEKPFKHVETFVKPTRDGLRRANHRNLWWIHGESRPGMRQAIRGLNRYIVTPRVSKHRIFTWLDAKILPDSRLVIFARDDDTTFGVLHSRFHERWSLTLGGWHGVGNDPQYTPSLGFSSFPFPYDATSISSSTGEKSSASLARIGKCSSKLTALRENWLTPPELVKVEPEVTSGYPDRVIPLSLEAAGELRRRTLTALYNERPTWLDKAHRELDAAVAAAYGWPEDISTEDALARLLELNRERAAAQGKA